MDMYPEMFIMILIYSTLLPLILYQYRTWTWTLYQYLQIQFLQLCIEGNIKNGNNSMYSINVCIPGLQFMIIFVTD